MKKGTESPYFKNRTGETHITKQGYEVEIIECFSAKDCTIKFNDVNSTILKRVQYCHIKEKTVKNPYHKTVFDRGFIGDLSDFISKRLNYNTWYHMMDRCYNPNLHKKRRTYKEATVCEEWFSFQNFSKWFDDNHIEKCHLDKDILIKGNKIYSPETCCFVPPEINTLFTKANHFRGELPIGVGKSKKRFRAIIHKLDNPIWLGQFKTKEEAFNAYKIAKENYIKEIADKYKNIINIKTHEAMYKYEVEITD